MNGLDMHAMGNSLLSDQPFAFVLALGLTRRFYDGQLIEDDGNKISYMGTYMWETCLPINLLYDGKKI